MKRAWASKSKIQSAFTLAYFISMRLYFKYFIFVYDSYIVSNNFIISSMILDKLPNWFLLFYSGLCTYKTIKVYKSKMESTFIFVHWHFIMIFLLFPAYLSQNLQSNKIISVHHLSRYFSTQFLFTRKKRNWITINHCNFAEDSSNKTFYFSICRKKYYVASENLKVRIDTGNSKTTLKCWQNKYI